MKWARRLGGALAAITTLIVALVLAHYPWHVDELKARSATLDRDDYRSFYGDRYYVGKEVQSSVAHDAVPAVRVPESPYAGTVTEFVRKHHLERARVLEVGAGRGALQDIVDDYTGLDIAGSQRPHFHKPFVEASATDMPFRDGEFDAIWTVNVLEHVPMPEQALVEMRRVVRDRGLIFLQAAWQCRPWAAQGFQVRPYADLDWEGRLVKASIPLRDSVGFRATYDFPIRLVRTVEATLAGSPTRLRYRLLEPNYERYWQPDSDAINAIDAYEVVLWFRSRGDEIVSFEGPWSPFFVRSGTLVVRIRKPAP